MKYTQKVNESTQKGMKSTRQATVYRCQVNEYRQRKGGEGEQNYTEREKRTKEIHIEAT